MKTITLSLPGMIATALALQIAPAQAQATRTWVSGVGDDVNPCSRTAPCKTFAGAISKTFINGEINCLDPGGFGTVTITKSITIDCHEVFASILASGTTGINIRIAQGGNDPLATVRLRNLNINGTGASGTVGTRTGIRGINIITAANVFLEDMLITDFSQQGILDGRTGGGKLFIRNSVIRNNAGTGIVVAGTAGVNAAIIENVHSNGNSFGIAVAAGNTAMIKRSVFSGNTSAGVEADNTAQVNVDDSAISHNVTGVQAAGTIRLSNNDISFNGTGISGPTISFGNNRILGNTNAGTAPTPAGAASSDRGQQ